MERDNTEKLRDLALRGGATLFGVGFVGDLLESFDLISPQAKDGLDFGVSLGVQLSRRVLEDVENHPTKLYYYHYRQVNYALDRLALEVVGFLQASGYQALPIPTSQTIDWENQRGHLSHKAVGVRAGLGWIGRNNLLVNPIYGSRVRYVSVLTDMPLLTTLPPPRAGGDCGACQQCIHVCPVGAIGLSRDLYDRKRCLDALKEFSRRHNIGHYICGICVRACFNLGR